jgi:stearoyl-CoA desaturase (delta-9 desaturase)
MNVYSDAGRGAFKVNSLTGLDRASPVEGEVVSDAPRSLWNTGMLLAALILGPLTFSGSALVVFVLTAGVTLCAGQLRVFEMAGAHAHPVRDGGRHGRADLDDPPA